MVASAAVIALSSGTSTAPTANSYSALTASSPIIVNVTTRFTAADRRAGPRTR